MNTALEVIEQSESHFTNALSTNEVNWGQESQFAMQALQKNDYLAEVATKSQYTLQNAIINVAAIGISLNPVLKHAYLVPRDGQVILDISYMGLLNLAVKTGSIVLGQAKLVYEKDTYVNNGIDKAPTHQQKTFGNKGEVVGVYCTVKLPSGEYLTEEMDLEVLNKIRKASSTRAGGNNPWTNWPDEMMRKSVVKRAAKYWPVSERMATATEYLNQVEGNHEKIINDDPETGEPVLPDYPQELFDQKFPEWVGLIDEGKQSASHILSFLQLRAKLTEEMIKRINKIGEPSE